MARVINNSLFFVPTGAARPADATLPVSRAGNFCRVTRHTGHGDTVTLRGSGGQGAVQHESGKAHGKIVWKAAMFNSIGVNRSIFPSRNPVTHVWGQTANGGDVFQMLERLNIARVMPAEHVNASLRDLKRHSFHPFGMREAFKPALQRLFHVAKNVSTL